MPCEGGLSKPSGGDGEVVQRGELGGENFLLAILPILLYQVVALLGERELGEQYGQQGEA